MSDDHYANLTPRWIAMDLGPDRHPQKNQNTTKPGVKRRANSFVKAFSCLFFIFTNRATKKTFLCSTGGSDEAICYAETATEGGRKFTVHLININGEEVLNKRKVYERSRGKAWNSEQSLLRLAAAVLKANRELKARFQTDSAIEVTISLFY